MAETKWKKNVATDPLGIRFSYPKDRDGDGIASCEDPDDGEIYVSPLLTPGVNGPEATWQGKTYRTVRHLIG